MSALFSSLTSTVDDPLQEQLIHCFNIQNAVIQNLNQYSQQISLQLLDVKNQVDRLVHHVLDLQTQQELRRLYAPPPPPPPPPVLPMLFPFLPQDEPRPVIPLAPPPPPHSFSFKSEQTSLNEPFIFTPIRATNINSPIEVDEESDEPTIPFTPIVELAPVDTKTGEEDEDILFCERAKLYRYDLVTREYKERGTGPMKILQHRVAGLCRILMRREQIWKICANHQITADMDLKSHQGKHTALLWTAVDFAEGVPKEELFCIRFKSKDLADQFYRIFDEAKQINQKIKKSINGTSELPSIERISLDQEPTETDEDEDPIVIHEVTPTAEQIERARQLQLPLTFYLYENKAPCPGCRGCDKDPIAQALFNGLPMTLETRNLILQTLPQISKSFPPNANLVPLMLIDPATARNYRPIVRAKRTLPINRVPPPVASTPNAVVDQEQGSKAQGHQKKSRHVPSPSPSSSSPPQHTPSFSLDDYAEDLTKTILNSVKQDLYKQLNEGSSVNEDEDQSPTTNKSLDRISFSSSDSHSGFPFSNFNSTVDSSKPFLFSFQPQSTLTFAEEATDQLIVPPSASSTDEEENMLFCESATLYRMDDSDGALKEIGTGLMKILRDPSSDFYQLFMHQQEEFEIYLDHRISSDIELDLYSKRDNTFSLPLIDDQTRLVTFETSDMAEKFLQRFNEAKKHNATVRQGSPSDPN